MNTTASKGNWNEQKNRLREKFSSLTESDLQFTNDRKNEMFFKVQLKLGKTKDELIRIISTL